MSVKIVAFNKLHIAATVTMESNSQQSCSFWLPKKNRTCGARSIKGGRFCGNHCSEGLKNRVPCPLDPNHTILETEISAHLKKCPSIRQLQEIENKPYFSKDINAGNLEREILAMNMTPKERRAIASKLTHEKFSELMEKVKFCAQKELKDGNIFKKSIIFPPEFDEIGKEEKERGIPFSKKHGLQQASIIGNMELFGLVEGENERDNSTLTFVEFGAGRGYLSQIICDYFGGKNFLLVDRRGYKFKADRTLRKAEDVQIERVKVDIRDLELSNFPSLKGRKFVGLSKHLCGSATDLTLRCCLGTHSNEKPSVSPPFDPQLKGIVIATCCHHLCSWSTYSNRSFFEKLGFTPLDFELISWFTSWAVTRKKNNPETCGILSPSERSKKEETNSTEEIQSFPWSALSETEKENFGFTCKALIDLGRVDFMVERGLIVSALEYVEADISPENKLILAKTP